MFCIFITRLFSECIFEKLSYCSNSVVKMLFRTAVGCSLIACQWVVRLYVSQSGYVLDSIIISRAWSEYNKCWYGYGGDTRWRRLRNKLAQVSCASLLLQIFMQVHASSADNTSNKNGRSWMKQITFSILSVDHSMGTQNFYLNNLNNFKK